jgi:hypothetical protein
MVNAIAVLFNSTFPIKLFSARSAIVRIADASLGRQS